MDSDSLSIPDAEIYWKLKPERKTISNFEGYFKVESEEKMDTLVISALFFKTRKIAYSEADPNKKLKIVLEKSSTELGKVLLVSQDPITEKFAVSKIGQMDIHFNPVANDDPLNAIKILPASTSTSESAEPALRGGSPERSRVYVNGVPILKPVRNSQDNGLTSFSLFNTDMISWQYVFASNPPLTYGNASAGLVSIETAKQLSTEDLRLSLALSNVGIMLNKNVSQKSFIQFYINKQFSGLFTKVNKPYIEDLHSFSSVDGGLNFRTEIASKVTFNSFNYGIDESYKGLQHRWNYSGDSKARQQRFFSVNNIDYKKNRSFFRLKTLFDMTRRIYQYGNVDANNHIDKFFVSLSHKYKWSDRLTMQYGWDFYRSDYDYEERRPDFFYGFHPKDPSHKNKEKIKFDYNEAFLYLNYRIYSQVGLAGAIRKNFFKRNQISDFWSYQLSGYYHLTDTHKIILGAGNYHSYSIPNEYQHQIHLLNSKQIALDYQFENDEFEFTTALYYKEDRGEMRINDEEQYDKIKSTGLEMSFKYPFNKYFTVGISNTFLKQRGIREGEAFYTSNNLKYNFKTQLSYINFNVLSASLALITRPGERFTPVEGGAYNALKDVHVPSFKAFNSQVLPSYFRLDFTVNHVFNVGGNALIAYGVVNNILNTQNAAYLYYSKDFSEPYKKHYQNRIFYVGLQFRFHSLFKN